MQVKIDKIDNLGRGITYLNNKICFIENALPDEIVEIKIIKENKKYSEAVVVEYLEKSSLRIEEECPYSNLCGGCQLNHFCYNEENKFKVEKVKELIKKYAEINTDIIENISYSNRNHYRNKIVLHGDGEVLGLCQKNTNQIIPINKCLLENDKINELIQLLTYHNKGIKEVIIKTSNDNEESMISIVGEIDNEESLMNLCNVLIINGVYKTNKKNIITRIGSKKYYESISSFFQVNNTLTKDLYDEVLEEVKNKSFQTALDLYCGTGTIGIYISEYVGKIIGIDCNESNIEDANNNKKLNEIENIDFILDKVENQIDTFKNIDLIIVDPPRAGLDSKTRNYLKEINPKEIIYVSCDSLTLARDLKELKESYSITRIKPFNMFPRSYHVECVCLLCRKS